MSLWEFLDYLSFFFLKRQRKVFDVSRKNYKKKLTRYISRGFGVYHQRGGLPHNCIHLQRVPSQVRRQFDHDNQGLPRMRWRTPERSSIDTEKVKTPVTRPTLWRIRLANNLFAIPFGGQACLSQSPIVARREREWCNRYGIDDKNRYTADAIRECKDSVVSRAKSGKSDFKNGREKASSRGEISSVAD